MGLITKTELVEKCKSIVNTKIEILNVYHQREETSIGNNEGLVRSDMYMITSLLEKYDREIKQLSGIMTSNELKNTLSIFNENEAKEAAIVDEVAGYVKKFEIQNSDKKYTQEDTQEL